jgi:chromosome segregation ATPase
MANWNVYKRILDEKIGETEHDLKEAESKYKELKSKLNALRMEEQAFEDNMQIKMDELGVEVEFAPIEKEENTPFFKGYKPTFFFNTTDTKLTKEDHEAAQLSIFFSGNI